MVYGTHMLIAVSENESLEIFRYTLVTGVFTWLVVKRKLISTEISFITKKTRIQSRFGVGSFDHQFMANFFFSVDSTIFSFPAIEWPSSNYNISFDARSKYFKSPPKTKNSFRKSSSNSLHSSYCALARKPLKQWSQWQLDFFIYLNWSPFLLNSVL